MMKKIFSILLLITMCIVLTGCQQHFAKNLGGTVTITLNPGEKLEEITWKGEEGDLWYLTRPMRPDEKAETHTFHESADIGFEGTVIIIEQEGNTNE